MNDIIKSLAKNHLLHDKYGPDGEVIEGDYYEFDERELVKFAESIVRQCAVVSKCNGHLGGFVLGDLLKEYFGVGK